MTRAASSNQSPARSFVPFGAGSLRIARTGPAVAAGADAVALAQDVLNGLEAGRPALEQTLTADGAAWTIYNARFVRQSFEWRNDPSQLSREVSMAQNTIPPLNLINPPQSHLIKNIHRQPITSLRRMHQHPPDAQSLSRPL